MKYFQRTGRFPQHENDLPGIVITYLATQVDVDASAYLQYDWQGRTIEYHRAQIRAALGFREASVSDGETMSQWLAEHVLPHLLDVLEFRCNNELYQPIIRALTPLVKDYVHSPRQYYPEEEIVPIRILSKRNGVISLW